MSRIVLFHWHAAEAEERAERLRRTGHQVTALARGDAPFLRPMRSDPPEIFVIDLQRTPSQGLAVGTWLRQQKAMRHVPLVFIAGDPAKTERVRQELPDALYTSWDSIGDALAQALANPVTEPKVPGTMHSYQGVALVKKLGIRPGASIALIGAPEGFQKTLGTLPQGAQVRQSEANTDIVLLFVRSQSELERGFSAMAQDVAEGGRLWVVWPKKTSGLASDVGERAVRAIGLAAGWVDYKIAAIDATWSGLCFTRRAQH